MADGEAAQLSESLGGGGALREMTSFDGRMNQTHALRF
jgi:hypothetical protein